MNSIIVCSEINSAVYSDSSSFVCRLSGSYEKRGTKFRFSLYYCVASLLLSIDLVCFSSIEHWATIKKNQGTVNQDNLSVFPFSKIVFAPYFPVCKCFLIMDFFKFSFLPNLSCRMPYDPKIVSVYFHDVFRCIYIISTHLHRWPCVYVYCIHIK